MNIKQYILGIKVKSLLLAIVVLIPIALVGIFINYCYTDHSKFIKTLANPIRDDLISFYEKNKRHLDLSTTGSFLETKALLRKHGCTNIKKVSGHWNDPGSKAEFSCEYKGKDMIIKVDILFEYRVGTPYELSFYRNKTRCHLHHSIEGGVNPIGGCYQVPCIFKRWGH